MTKKENVIRSEQKWTIENTRYITLKKKNISNMCFKIQDNKNKYKEHKPFPAKIGQNHFSLWEIM